MGENEFGRKVSVKVVTGALHEMMEQSSEALRLSTPGGRFHICWDEGGSAMAMGQLALFVEFLEATGLFARWLEGCPLIYTSPNAPAVTDLLGTWLLDTGWATALCTYR